MKTRFILGLDEAEEIHSNKYEFEWVADLGWYVDIEWAADLFNLVTEDMILAKREEICRHVEGMGQTENDYWYDSEDFFECYECEEIHAREDGVTEDSEGYLYCDGCRDRTLTKCTNCNRWFRPDDITHYDGSEGVEGQDLCDHCEDILTRTCDCCDEQVLISTMEHDGCDTSICRGCYEAYYTYCSRCDRLVHIDNEVYVEETDEHLCHSCYEEYEESLPGKVRPYHNRPRLHFNHAPGEATGCFIGCEIETEKGNYDSRRKIVADYGEKLFYMNKDGSLNSDGIEIISQPMSLKFFNEFKFEKMFSDLVKAGARAHEAEHCGLHVHLSRKWFGEDTEEQAENIGRLTALIDKVWKDYFRFSRRRPGQLQWCKKPGEDSTGKKECLTELASVSDIGTVYKKLGKVTGSRYEAVNTTNKNTVEFRIFRGTLNPVTFRASIQLCIRMIEYVKEAKDNKSWSWKNLLEFKELPPELAQYIAIRFK